MAKKETNELREFKLDEIRRCLSRAFYLTTVFNRASFVNEEETHAAFIAVMSEVCEAMDNIDAMFPAKTKVA